jgi:hypothetical protein
MIAWRRLSEACAGEAGGAGSADERSAARAGHTDRRGGAPIALREKQARFNALLMSLVHCGGMGGGEQTA